MSANLNDEDAVDNSTQHSTFYAQYARGIISRVLRDQEKNECIWTDDDIVECIVRITEMKGGAVPRFWSIRRVNDDKYRVELVGEASEYSVPSQVDPVIELKRLHESLQRYHEKYRVVHYIVSSTVLDVQVINSTYDRSSEILNHIKRVCREENLSPWAVIGQINQEKMARIERRIQNRLCLKKGGYSETTQLKRALVDQARKIQAQEAKIAEISAMQLKQSLVGQAQEAKIAEISAKLQFVKVLNEMERKNFGDVLAQIALARREAKATKLGFGRVFHEMKKRGFARLLEEITIAKRDAKAAELTKRLQLLQMEAQRAGIPLGTLDMPMVMPEVVIVTGVVSQYSDDIPMAIPISKE